MKTLNFVFLFAMLTNCAATKVADSWVNEDYKNYQPKKTLIIGLTDNLSGRTRFEEQVTNEFEKRGIDAVESYTVFNPTFTSSKQTEADIEEEIKKLSDKGFDSVLISVLKGVDERVSYTGDSFRTYDHWRRFGRYYYRAQDVYYTEGYYNRYKIYHIEASLYNLKENNDKSLVWVASYDVVDPKQVNKTVANYVTAIVNSLEENRIINSTNYED